MITAIMHQQINAAYLSPGHNFKQVVCIEPAEEPNHQDSRNGGQVACIEEGVRDAQKSCPEAIVDDQEKPEQDVHLRDLFPVWGAAFLP